MERSLAVFDGDGDTIRKVEPEVLQELVKLANWRITCPFSW
jgi:hypothetical protein